MNEPARPSMMPVFPLPGSVLFPGVPLPLYIFEPRYVQMVEDAMNGDRWLAVAQVLTDSSESPPAIHEVAGAGPITRSTRLPEGRYTIVVQGEARVRLTEVPCARLYRKVAVQQMPEPWDVLDGEEGLALLREMVDAASRLGILDADHVIIPEEIAGRGEVANQIAAGVLADPGERQSLLEADGHERLALVRRQLALAGSLTDALDRFPRPENPGRN